MDPILRAALSSWDWRIEVILVLACAGTFYTVGWWRLRGRSQRLAARWRVTAYLGGLVVMGLALLSPIDVLGGQLFLMHMIQHLLLIMIAPPLLLLANPMPFMLWGLPGSWRLPVGRAIGRLLHRKSPWRQGLRAATTPGIIWLFWVISVFGWHDPAAYNAALRSEWVHDVEHASFFLAGMLFWWHVTGAGPRIHKQIPLLGRIVFVLAAIPPNMMTGVVLAMAESPIYTYYTAVPRLWSISVMDDQRVGGLIMWVPGSMMYIIAAIVLLARLFNQEKMGGVSPGTASGTITTPSSPSERENVETTV